MKKLKKIALVFYCIRPLRESRKIVRVLSGKKKISLSQSLLSKNGLNHLLIELLSFIFLKQVGHSLRKKLLWFMQARIWSHRDTQKLLIAQIFFKKLSVRLKTPSPSITFLKNLAQLRSATLMRKITKNKGHKIRVNFLEALIKDWEDVPPLEWLLHWVGKHFQTIQWLK